VIKALLQPVAFDLTGNRALARKPCPAPIFGVGDGPNVVGQELFFAVAEQMAQRRG
jgi:hypothetical protein